MRSEGYDYDTYSRLAGPLTEPDPEAIPGPVPIPALERDRTEYGPSC